MKSEVPSGWWAVVAHCQRLTDKAGAYHVSASGNVDHRLKLDRRKLDAKTAFFKKRKT